MFLYVRNRYNPTPNIVLESDLTSDILNKYFAMKYLKAFYIELPDNIQSFDKQYGRKFIYNVKREKRLLKQFSSDVEFKILINRNDLMFFLPKVYELFNERWNKEYTSSCWKRKKCFQRYADAMIGLADTGEGFLGILHDKENLLSYAYCIVNKQKRIVYMYQHSAKRMKFPVSISLGKILIYDLINYLINKKFKILDFMIGSSPYKIMWTKNNYYWTYMLFPKTPKGLLLMAFYKIKIFFQFWPPSRKVLKLTFNFTEKLWNRLREK